MRVLDLGCGVGDVSFLAAALVGASGAVVGVDHEYAALEMAEARRQDMALDQVSFERASLDDLPFDADFDAVVGRCILVHLRTPGVVLRDVVRFVRPGGIVAFHELGVHLPRWFQSAPSVPLWDAMGQWITGAIASTGSRIDAGGRLVQLFVGAGLPRPQVTCESPVDSGPDSPFYAWIAETVRTLIPRIVALGLATESEIDIDTLEERLRQHATAVDSQLVAPPQFCAWTRTPLRTNGASHV
jgi:SAM-dependent methyltransferase